MEWKQYMGIALGLRILMIFYGIWQDTNLFVKFTDIDYGVYTDAARAISLGHSPYTRLTFRYTPLLYEY